MLEMSTNLPVKIEVVESEKLLNKSYPNFNHVVAKGMVEIADTHVVKCCPKSETQYKDKGEHMRLEGKAKMLRIIISEDDRWEGEPLHEAIIKTGHDRYSGSQGV